MAWAVSKLIFSDASARRQVLSEMAASTARWVADQPLFDRRATTFCPFSRMLGELRGALCRLATIRSVTLT